MLDVLKSVLDPNHKNTNASVLSGEVSSYVSFHINLASLAGGLSNLFDLWDKPRAPTDHRNSLKWGH